MAISTYDLKEFKSKLVSHFIGGDNDRLDPCFAAFKRIKHIAAWRMNSDNFISKLKPADKASVRIDSLNIDKYVLREMSEFYKDKEVSLIIESLQLDNCYIDNLSDKEAKLINKINPKMLRINSIKCTVENIKALVLLNSIIIDAKFKDDMVKKFSLCFVKTPIQLFDFNHNQRLAFECESIEIFIEKDKIKNVKLLKTNTGNFLFIPLDTIGSILCSGFREIFSSNEIIKQFADLGAHHKFEDSGLIIPTRYSKKIFIRLDDSELDFLKQIKYINKIFKEKDIKLATWKFEKLLEIKKVFSEDFYCINFQYFNDCCEKIKEKSISKILNDPDCIKLKFFKIYKVGYLFPDQYRLLCKMLRSSKTRFNLISIDLSLNLLSECLNLLSLLSDCSELKSIELSYSNADTENGHEAVEQAKREFRQKFGFIQNLTIRNESE